MSNQREGLRDMHVALRTAGDPASAIAAVRQAVSEVDRHLPITDIKTQQDQIDETIGKERILTLLLSVFGGFAILLACIGATA